jgi:hypothetical protein
MKTLKMTALALVASLCFQSVSSASDCAYGGGYIGGAYNHSGLSITMSSPYVYRTYGTRTNLYSGYRGYGYQGQAGPGRISGYRSFAMPYDPGFDVRPPVWQDTSHYHFQPGRYILNGPYLDYVPARYHYHQSGYWDR